MGSLRRLTEELRGLLEDGAGGGVPIGSAPAGGASTTPYMGAVLPGAEGTPECPSCGSQMPSTGSCPTCFPYGPPMRPLGALRDTPAERKPPGKDYPGRKKGKKKAKGK